MALLYNQFNNTSPEKDNDPVNVVNSKYYDIDQIQTLKFPNKHKSLSLFHINACSLNKNFDDLDHLLKCTNKVQFVRGPVFLTHVGIRQMPMWLLMWKAKSLYHVSTFLPMRFFLPLQKFKTIKIKLEKSPYTQANTYLLHFSRKIFSIIYALLLIFSKL